MKFKKITHKNILSDGTHSDGKPGALVTTGSVRMSKGEGCGLSNCHCSDGYWITICLPLKNGKVNGVNIQFDNKEEMDYFLTHHTLDGDTNIHEPIEEEDLN